MPMELPSPDDAAHWLRSPRFLCSSVASLGDGALLALAPLVGHLFGGGGAQLSRACFPRLFPRRPPSSSHSLASRQPP